MKTECSYNCANNSVRPKSKAKDQFYTLASWMDTFNIKKCHNINWKVWSAFQICTAICGSSVPKMSTYNGITGENRVIHSAGKISSLYQLFWIIRTV